MTKWSETREVRCGQALFTVPYLDLWDLFLMILITEYLFKKQTKIIPDVLRRNVWISLGFSFNKTWALIIFKPLQSANEYILARSLLRTLGSVSDPIKCIYSKSESNGDQSCKNEPDRNDISCNYLTYYRPFFVICKIASKLTSNQLNIYNAYKIESK